MMLKTALLAAVPKSLRPIVPFVIIVSFTYVLSSANLLEEFTPRTVCMQFNKILITLQGTTDGVIACSKIVVGVILFRLYAFLRKNGFPYSDFAWRIGGFVFWGGLTHVMGVLNLFHPYYWIDGIIKLITAWYCLLVALTMVKEYPQLKQLKAPKEYAELRQKLSEALELIKKQ